MNSLKQPQFGGVFGGVVETAERRAIEFKGVMVRPSGFEPPTFCSGGKRSIQLSYGRTMNSTSIVVTFRSEGQITKLPWLSQSPRVDVVGCTLGSFSSHGEVAEWSKAAVC